MSASCQYDLNTADVSLARTRKFRSSRMSRPTDTRQTRSSVRYRCSFSIFYRVFLLCHRKMANIQRMLLMFRSRRFRNSTFSQTFVCLGYDSFDKLIFTHHILLSAKLIIIHYTSEKKYCRINITHFSRKIDEQEDLYFEWSYKFLLTYFLDID